jgi:AbrB family looped-hinge helix DNA binding protein
MLAVTVSTKYQVVIPQPVRELLGIHPGEKLQVLVIDNRTNCCRSRRRVVCAASWPVSTRPWSASRTAHEPGRLVRMVGLMRQADCVDLTDSLALGATQVSVDLKLSLADSIIFHFSYRPTIRGHSVDPGRPFRGARRRQLHKKI